MGVFDNVKLGLDIVLPEFTHGDSTQVEWQTKDIRTPCMDTYIIKNNKLFKVCHEWEEIPLTERVNVGGFNIPLIRPKRTWEEDTDYHGKFSFYTVIQESGEIGKDIWYEYEAKFTDGELVSIKIKSKRDEFVRRTVVLPNE